MAICKWCKTPTKKYPAFSNGKKILVDVYKWPANCLSLRVRAEKKARQMMRKTRKRMQWQGKITGGQVSQ